MSALHDFRDGRGPVPAHQHPNGGGWVADTARVAASAFVGPGAQVFGAAWVSGNAQVSGDARVYGDAQFLVIGPIGSRAAYLTWTASDNCVATGCFRGAVDEFRAAVLATHGDNNHSREYLAVLALIECRAANIKQSEPQP